MFRLVAIRVEHTLTTIGFQGLIIGAGSLEAPSQTLKVNRDQHPKRMSPLPDERAAAEVQASAATGTIQPDDVVISGMSGTYANCHNVNELSQKLYAKHETPLTHVISDTTQSSQASLEALVLMTVSAISRNRSLSAVLENRAVITIIQQDDVFWSFRAFRLFLIKSHQAICRTTGRHAYNTYFSCQERRDSLSYMAVSMSSSSTVDITVNEKPRWGYQHPEAPKYVGIAPDLGSFDAQFFKVHRKLGLAMDVLSRKLLEHAYQAIYDAGISSVELRGKKVGVFVGSALSDCEKVCFYVPSTINALGIAGCSRSMFANRISYWLDARGPSINIDAACSSSAVALERACDYMKRGICEAAIVGGANLCFHPHVSVHFKRLGVLCDDGKTRSFDKNAGGAVRADAVNCLFLQKAKNAKRIYSKVVYVKSSYTIDNAVESKELKFGPMRPKKCLIEFWNDFYREANVSPQVVEYVEAYGSAVPESDRAELDAIGEVFCKGKEDPLPVGSVISNIGHTEAASGVSAVTKVLLAYHSGQIAANLYYETPHDQVQAIREGKLQVVVENQTFSRTYAAVNSHSLGGLNCHTLLHGFYKSKDLEKYKTTIPRLVTVSGRTESGVSKIIDQLKAQPLDAEEIGLLHNIHKQDIQGHLARGYAVLTTNEEGHTVSLAENCDYYPDIRRPVWFVYSGMGSQWAGMGAQLMRIPIFARAIEKCRRVLEPEGVDLIKILVEPDKAIYDNILNSFVGIAAVQIGLTDVLRELNVVPDNIIGHSVGELGCAYADECFTAEEMILSAYSRGLVSIKTPFIRGAMAAVGLGYKDVVDLCPPEIEVACHNGPESSTISGPAEVMHAFVQELTAKGIFAKEVQCSNIAYHSRYIAEAVSDRAGAAIASAVLHGLSSDIVIDKSKLRRERRKTSDTLMKNQAPLNLPALCFDGRKDKTLKIVKKGTKRYKQVVIEEHVSVIKEPESIYVGHLFDYLDGKTSGPSTYNGPIGKLLDKCETRAVVEFESIPGPDLLKYLKELIKDPKQRSQKWVSTSVPRDKWDEPEAKYSSAEYHTNNLLRSVLFEETSRLIPHNAVVIEIAPHGLLQAILKRSLGPNCVHIPLTRRGHSDAVTFLLDNIGKLYQAGLTPQVQALYPQIEFPVSTGTPMLSHLVEWMHSEKWPLPKYAEPNYRKSGRRTILVSVHDEEYKYITGNVKNGAIFFSEAGILVLVWETLAMILDKKMNEVPVQFCYVRFDSDVIATDDEVLVFDVTIQKGSGQFEVSHKRSIVASGRIRTYRKEIMSTVVIEPVEEEHMTSSEIYKMFHIRGYSFRCGGVLLQDITLNDIPQPERPTVIKRREFVPYHPVETFDVNTVVHVFLQIVAENSTDGTINAIEFVMSKDEQPLGGLMKMISNELTNVDFNHKTIQFEILSDIKIFKHPNLLIGHNLLSDKKIQQVLAKIIDEHKFIISIEKNEILDTKSSYVEIAAAKTSRGRLILARIQTKEGVNEDVSFVAAPEDVANTSFIEHIRNNLLPTQRLILITDMSPPSGLRALICKWKAESEKNKINLIITDTLTDSDCNLNEQLNKNLALMMYRKGSWGCEYFLPSSDDQVINPSTGMNITVPEDTQRISSIEISEDLSSKSVQNTAVTDLDDDATTSSYRVSKRKKRVCDKSYFSFEFIDSNDSPLGMICNKLLPNSSMAPVELRRHLETVHPESKDKNKEFFVRKKEQLLESQKNMMQVTLTNNEKATEASYLVSYRIAQAGEEHTIAENLKKPCVLNITKCMHHEKSAKHFFTVPLSNDTVLRRIHDLASYVKQKLVTRLQKTRLTLQMDDSTDVAGLAILQVKYAGLTHYDVTEAAGATPDARDKGLHCMDYSGFNSRGDRVMGVVASGALAPSVVPDEDLLWPVPEHWTLEDAATVPQPYIHAFYCLSIKSKFQDGFRILVHCGAGALGQAIISIALGMSCEVFTTVSSIQNKRFLKSLFPELEDNHIGSCRDVSFEHVVMEQTNGEGCTFVVSCLDGELREPPASMWPPQVTGDQQPQPARAGSRTELTHYEIKNIIARPATGFDVVAAGDGRSAAPIPRMRAFPPKSFTVKLNI
ncbi:Fatty acid synthase [Eumeta japonica]|uniref:Fatty acid synthase n=1 Tax=Eumeta variegata TaxID=151549 RepID=A0A4C1WK22_EUMVA|nr:Fatty acid synthase [Eumeta japonica]